MRLTSSGCALIASCPIAQCALSGMLKHGRDANNGMIFQESLLLQSCALVAENSNTDSFTTTFTGTGASCNRRANVKSSVMQKIRRLLGSQHAPVMTPQLVQCLLGHDIDHDATGVHETPPTYETVAPCARPRLLLQRVHVEEAE